MSREYVLPEHLRGRPMADPLIGIVHRDRESCLKRVGWLKARFDEDPARLKNANATGSYGDAWEELANAYADEAGDPHPEIKPIPAGQMSVDELLQRALDLDSKRDQLEAVIGGYAYAMRAAVAWYCLSDAIQAN